MDQTQKLEWHHNDIRNKIKPLSSVPHNRVQFAALLKVKLFGIMVYIGSYETSYMCKYSQRKISDLFSQVGQLESRWSSLLDYVHDRLPTSRPNL